MFKISLIHKLLDDDALIMKSFFKKLDGNYFVIGNSSLDGNYLVICNSSLGFVSFSRKVYDVSITG